MLQCFAGSWEEFLPNMQVFNRPGVAGGYYFFLSSMYRDIFSASPFYSYAAPCIMVKNGAFCPLSALRSVLRPCSGRCLLHHQTSSISLTALNIFPQCTTVLDKMNSAVFLSLLLYFLVVFFLLLQSSLFFSCLSSNVFSLLYPSGLNTVAFCLRELLIKKMQLNYGLLSKRSDPPPPSPPRLSELLGHFFVG